MNHSNFPSQNSRKIGRKFPLPRLTLFARLLLGLVFIIAALLKWFDPANGTTYYGNLAHAAPLIGWAIIVGELLLGAWLLFGFRSALAAGTALFALALFSGAIVADMLAKHPIPCGCFGAAWAAAHSPAAIEHGLAIGLMRDATFILLAAAILFRQPAANAGNKREECTQSGPGTSPSAAG